MAIVRKYQLRAKEKEIILAYLRDEITRAEAAAAFGMSSQNFPNIVLHVVKHFIKEGDVDIERAMKEY